MASGRVDERAGSRWAVGNGLFHHDVEPQLDEPRSNLRMGDGSGCDHSRVGLAGELLKSTEHGAAVESRRLRATSLVDIQDARQFGVFGLMDDTKMVPAESASANHCDPEFCHCRKPNTTRHIP